MCLGLEEKIEGIEANIVWPKVMSYLGYFRNEGLGSRYSVNHRKRELERMWEGIGARKREMSRRDKSPP